MTMMMTIMQLSEHNILGGFTGLAQYPLEYEWGLNLPKKWSYTDVIEDMVQRLSIPNAVFREASQRLTVIGQPHLRQIITGRPNIMML